MIEKNTQHGFETNDVLIQMTEYPFQPGEELHLKIAPMNEFDYVEMHGNPKSEQTLVIRNGDFIMWITSDDLVDLVEKAVKKYRKGWKEHNKNLAMFNSDSNNTSNQTIIKETEK